MTEETGVGWVGEVDWLDEGAVWVVAAIGCDGAVKAENGGAWRGNALVQAVYVLGYDERASRL